MWSTARRHSLAARVLAGIKAFDESQHPRDQNGKFSSGGDSSADNAAASDHAAFHVDGGAMVDRLASDGGFTVMADGSTPTSGYGIAVAGSRELQVPMTEIGPQHIADYVSANRDLLSQPGHALGGWVDGGTAYLDTSQVIQSKADAITQGRALNQKALWDFASSQEVLLDHGA